MIEIIKNNIIKIPADAIVNAANRSAFDKSIKEFLEEIQRHGPDLNRESQKGQAHCTNLYIPGLRNTRLCDRGT